MNKWEIEVQKSLLQSEAAAIKALEAQYKRALSNINERVKDFQAEIDMLDAAVNHDGIDETTRAILLSQKRSKIYQKQYQEALQGQISGILDKMHGDSYSTIQDYLKGSYESGYVGTMYDIAKQGVPVIVPIDQAAAVRAILTDSKVSKGLYSRLGVEVSSLKRIITQEISRGISVGMSYADIARNIANVSKAPLSRTKTIARTEGHRIQQASTVDAQQAAKAKGADVLKQWDAALDGRTRPSHAMVDGEIRELDEKFSNGLMYPGDPSGSAAEVINCRCTSDTRARWALDEEELNILKERAEFFGLDKTESFEDFKRKYLQASEFEATREKRKTSEGVFETFNNSSADTIRPHSIIKDMKKSEYGQAMLDYINAENVPVRLLYGVDNEHGILGYYDPFDDAIFIFCDKTRTIKETSKTVIHEATHRKLRNSGIAPFDEEVECFKAELLHEKGALTSEEIAAIIKFVEENYPDLERG